MPTHHRHHRHQNPSAYIDARGIARVQMPEQQEGIPGPRIANMVRSLGISRAAAERLREKMRRADETGDGIEDILREAQRALRAKSVAYYPGAADAPGAPDGIAFVDRGDPKAETLLYDHRDGRFTVNAWGPAVARQRERFSKNNPDPAKRQNPPRTIVCLTGFGDWWSVSEDQWPKVVRAGMAGDNEAAVKQATRVRQKPWAAVGSAVPVLRSVFDLTPEDWEYYDKEVRDAAASAERARKAARRKNPPNIATGAFMPTQFVTNPRRPAKKRPARRNPTLKSPHAGPSVKRMVDFLGISKADAEMLKAKMNDGASVSSILKAADRILDGNGVEGIGGYGGGLSYVNMGDTYDDTLIYDSKSRRFVVSSWGDIVEAQPRRFED